MGRKENFDINKYCSFKTKIEQQWIWAIISMILTHWKSKITTRYNFYPMEIGMSASWVKSMTSIPRYNRNSIRRSNSKMKSEKAVRSRHQGLYECQPAE